MADDTAPPWQPFPRLSDEQRQRIIEQARRELPLLDAVHAAVMENLERAGKGLPRRPLPPFPKLPPIGSDV